MDNSKESKERSDKTSMEGSKGAGADTATTIPVSENRISEEKDGIEGPSRTLVEEIKPEREESSCGGDTSKHLGEKSKDPGEKTGTADGDTEDDKSPNDKTSTKEESKPAKDESTVDGEKLSIPDQKPPSDQPTITGNSPEKPPNDKPTIGDGTREPSVEKAVINDKPATESDKKPSAEPTEDVLQHIKFRAPSRFDLPPPAHLVVSRTKPEDKRWYAGMDNYESSYGVSAVFSRFRPEVQSQDQSIIQLGAFNGDPSHPFQSVEAGWRRTGHAEPEVFIYFTTTNYKVDGTGSGGYVTDFDKDDGDFQWLPTVTKPRGVLFRGLPVSHIDGDQLTVGLRFKLQKNVPGMVDGWYLAVDNNFVGYYPCSLFTATPPATLMNPNTNAPYGPLDPSKTLADHSNYVSIYGEIYDAGFDRSLPNPGVPTTTDMGSGRFPNEGWGKVAFISNIMRRSDMGETWVDASKSSWPLKTGNYIDTTKYDLFFCPVTDSDFGAFVYLGGSGNAKASGTWTEWDVISPLDILLDAPPKVRLTAITRVQDRIDLFAVTPDGVVRSCFWSDGDWSGIVKVADWDVINWGQDNPKFGWGTEIVALCRDEQSLDIFGLATDGHVWTARWDPDEDWSGWWNISQTMNFPQNAPIAGCVRSDSHMDLFVNNNGTIVTATWDDDAGTWSGAENDWLVLDSDRPAIDDDALILALARDEDTMDVFVVANTGVVYDLSYVTNADGEEASWGSFEPIGTMQGDGGSVMDGFDSGARLAGVARGSDKIDLFCIGTNGDFYTSTWTTDDGWSSVGGEDGDYWTWLGSPPNGVAFGADSYIAALVRPFTTNIDVFVGGEDGLIYRTAWDDTKQTWMSDPVSDDLDWDDGIGGAIRGRSDFQNTAGFFFSVASTQVFALMVIAVQQNTRIYATSYEGP